MIYLANTIRIDLKATVIWQKGSTPLVDLIVFKRNEKWAYELLFSSESWEENHVESLW